MDLVENKEKKRWTKGELDILKKYYPLEGENVAERLSDRTKKSCRIKASKLGISKQKSEDSINKIFIEKEQKSEEIATDPQSTILKFGELWTSEEDEILKKYYPSEGTMIWKRLPGRSKKACKTRAFLLQVKYEGYQYFWTLEEDNILKKYYRTEGGAVCNRLTNRTREACIKRARILNLNQKEVWTEEETEILKKFYATEGKNVAVRLPGKSMMSCYKKAQMLGLKKDNVSLPWTTKEDQILIENYPKIGPKGVSKLLAEKLGSERSLYGCRGRACFLKIRYEKAPEAWTKEEEKIIKKYYKKEGYDVAKRLNNRTKTACIEKIRKMGLENQKKLFVGPTLGKWIKNNFNNIKEVQTSMLRSEIILYSKSEIGDLHIISVLDQEGNFIFTDNGNITKTCSLTEKHIGQIVNDFGLNYQNGQIVLKYNETDGEREIVLFLTCCYAVLYINKKYILNGKS